MKVTTQENNKEQETKYPYIGIGKSKVIVLFYEDNKGICLDKGDSSVYYIGYYSTYWETSYFKPYNVKITLEND